MNAESKSEQRRVLTALPVYNEARHVAEVLAEVRRYASEILVVDDGSTDDTPRVLTGETGLHVVTHERNLGYGAALRAAFAFAIDNSYDVLVTIDCDGQHEPRRIPDLAAAVFPANQPPVDIVSGSRYLRDLPGNSEPPAERRRINSVLTQMLNDRLGLELTDAFCGFKAYRVAVLGHLRITELGYAMPIQVWVQAAALGLRIVEYPVPLVYLDEKRSFGGSLDDGQRRMTYYRQVLDREIEAVAFSSPRVKSRANRDARV